MRHWTSKVLLILEGVHRAPPTLIFGFHTRLTHTPIHIVYDLHIMVGTQAEIALIFTSTEEEISAMQQELDKYGINMPAFGKIGGILANEVLFQNLLN